MFFGRINRSDTTQATLVLCTSVKPREELGVLLGLLHQKQCGPLESFRGFGGLTFTL
jgi:hypothetical protein